MRHKYANQWLSEGRAVLLPTEISSAFDEHIDALPWNGSVGLSWSRMPASSRFNVAGRSPSEVRDWLKTTSLGRRSHVAVWYSADEGGIVVPFAEGAAALDELYCDAPGTRFSFGAAIENGKVVAFFSDILQYGYGDLLIATV